MHSVARLALAGYIDNIQVSGKLWSVWIRCREVQWWASRQAHEEEYLLE